MARIKSRTSCDTGGLPVCACRTFQVQNQTETLAVPGDDGLGLHRSSPGQAPDNHAQKTRSATVNFGRFLAERRSTPIWWRRARFSTWRAVRERKTENRVARNAAPARTSASCWNRAIRSGLLAKASETPSTRLRVSTWCHAHGTPRGGGGGNLIRKSRKYNKAHDLLILFSIALTRSRRGCSNSSNFWNGTKSPVLSLASRHLSPLPCRFRDVLNALWRHCNERQGIRRCHMDYIHEMNSGHSGSPFDPGCHAVQARRSPTVKYS
jgi:hypothetical protein